MLHIINKITNRSRLVLFDKEKYDFTSFLDAVEIKSIEQKISKGLSLSQIIKNNVSYYFLPLNLNGNDDVVNERLRIAGHSTYNQLKELKENQIFLQVESNLKEDNLVSLITGLLLSDYEFLKYKPNSKPFGLRIDMLNQTISKSAVDEINLLIESVNLTKDLVNEPVSYLTAVQYSKEIQKLGKDAGFSVTVWNQKKIEQEKMGGLIAVNRGSSAPATFNILEYKPTKAINKKPLVLVGKGVVYDTGGLSLKPTKNSMDLMKCDMAGSATVVGAMYAIAKAKLPYHVIGLIPAVENRPGYEATCPGDIITMYDGTTVEVLDTDAEGRLILADALHYAKRLKPELVLDFATLTGSAMRAIGREASVIMGNATDAVKDEIKKVSNSTGERTVEFPFWEEYADYMKSDIADLKNLGPAEAGSITAGKFLEHFTDYPWMHFDIAGPAFLTTTYNYRGKWATGYGVRLLFKFVQNQCENVNRK
jgi:leucyl aminopeptidase